MKMSRRVELDLNQILPPAPPPLHPTAELWSSVKDALRQSILEHEIAFKHQVQELHRLYWTQKNLMNDLALEIKEECSTDNKSRFPMLQRNSFAFHTNGQKDTNLQAPLNSSAGGFGLDVAGNQYSDMKDFIASQSKTNIGRTKINCSTSKINRGQSSQNVRCFIDLEAPVEMDLDEVPTVEASLVPDTLAVNGTDASFAVLFNSSSSRMMEGDYLRKAAKYHSCVPQLREKQTKEASVLSFDDALDSGPYDSVNQPRQKQQLRSTHLNIDLNVAQDDKPTNSYTVTPKAFSPPSTSSSNGEIWRESSSKNKSGSELSNVCPEGSKTAVPAVVIRGLENILPDAFKNDLHSSTQVSEESTKFEENSWKHGDSGLNNVVDKFGSEDVFDIFRQPMERCSTASNKVSTNAKVITVVSGKPQQFTGDRLPNSNAASSNEIEDNCVHASAESNNLLPGMVENRRENETQESEDTVSYENNLDELDKLSGFKKVKLSAQNYGLGLQCNDSRELVELSTSENYRSMVDSSKMLGSEQVPVTKNSDCACSHGVSCGNGLSSNQEYAEEQQAQGVGLDFLIVKAAETLVSFSENPACINQEVESSSNGKAVKNDQSNDQYEISFNSFEWLTMNIEEIKDDANSFGCKQITNETGKGSCGIKLRRGRGMRDFQDILSGLVSLSRKEICEDIHKIQSHPRKNRSRQSRRCL